MKLNQHLADRIVHRLVHVYGFANCESRDVWDVYNTGSIEPGIVGDDHDAAMESRILQELEEYGVEPK